jgi:CRISPR system Cascade subunit CasB
MTGAGAAATRDVAFIAYLKDLSQRDDRAALAALRRGLGKEPGTAIDAYKHVLRFNPRQWEEEWFCLVAALFALHPTDWPVDETHGRRSTNFGASLARLWLKREAGRDGLERRLVALLNAHREDLPDKLRHAVSLLRAEEVPVDWLQLLRDLRGWEADNRRVQRSWARAYWGSASEAGIAAAGPTAAVAGDVELDSTEEDA